MGKGTKYGVEKAYYAPMNVESVSAITYYDPVALAALQQVVMNPRIIKVQVPGDNGVVEIIYIVDGADGSMQRAQFTDAELVALLGYKKLGNTVVGSGEPPYVAFGYKRTGTGRTHKYIWHLKAQFSEASATAEGQQPGGVTPQYDTLNYEAIRRLPDNEWRVFETKTFATAAEEAAFDAEWFSKAKLEILYNAATAVNGKPCDIREVAELPATGTAGILYRLTGATPGYHYWNGTAFVEVTPLT